MRPSFGRMSDGSTPRFLQGAFDFEGNGYGQTVADRRLAALRGARRRRHPAGVLPRRQLDRRDGHRRAVPRRKTDAVLPDRRQGRHPRRAAGGRGSAGRHRARAVRRRTGRAARAASSSTSVWWSSDDGPTRSRRRRATRRSSSSATAWPGSRAVEEILARGGGEMFDITVFGDEPYGNYNRILLSNVLAGSDDRPRSTSTRWTGTPTTAIDLRAGVRVVRIDRFAQAGARRRRHRTPLRQADPGDRQPGVLPADGRACGPTTRRWPTGVFGFRTLDDTARDDRRGRATAQRRWSSAAACSAWRPHAACRTAACDVDVVHAGPAPDERAARRRWPARSCAGRWRTLGIGVHTDKRTTEVLRPTDRPSTGIAFSDGEHARLRHARDRRRASGPTSAWRSAPD